jgi:hypothetical protein
LLLLMGDVNHRCANNMKKHVHSTTKKRERGGRTKKRRVVAVVVFFNILIVRHTETYTRTFQGTHVHLTLFVFFFSPFSLFCCYICVISTSWYPSSMDDDEKRERRRSLWMYARSNLEWWKELEE